MWSFVRENLVVEILDVVLGLFSPMSLKNIYLLCKLQYDTRC